MEITVGFLTKIGMGLAFLGIGGTSIYLGYDYVSNSLSQYDVALIEFLKKGDGNNNIIFEVKKGQNGEEDLGENDISLSGNNSPVTARVRVTTNTSTANTTFKVGANGADEEALRDIKKLEKTENSGWIWECSFSFKAIGEGVSGKNIKDDYKNKIWKNDGLGLFGLLKKDLSNYTDPTPADSTKWTKKEIVQAKIDFIRNCGYERGLDRNRKLNKEKAENSDIKVENIAIQFKLNEDNLIPQDESNFNYWFGQDKDKTYNLTSSGS